MMLSRSEAHNSIFKKFHLIFITFDIDGENSLSFFIERGKELVLASSKCGGSDLNTLLFKGMLFSIASSKGFPLKVSRVS